jgi:hypothetical protein
MEKIVKGAHPGPICIHSRKQTKTLNSTSSLPRASPPGSPSLASSPREADSLPRHRSPLIATGTPRVRFAVGTRSLVRSPPLPPRRGWSRWSSAPSHDHPPPLQPPEPDSAHLNRTLRCRRRPPLPDREGMCACFRPRSPVHSLRPA